MGDQLRVARTTVLAERLTAARRARGWRQRDVAALADVAPSQVGLWEIGRKQPTVTNLITVADVLGVSIDWLVGRTDEATVRSRRHGCSASDVTGDPPGSGDVAGLVLDDVQTTRVVELSEPDTAVPTSRQSGSLTIAN